MLLFGAGRTGGLDKQGALANLTGKVERGPVATQVVRITKTPLTLTNCRFACPCWGRAAKHQLATNKIKSLASSETNQRAREGRQVPWREADPHTEFQHRCTRVAERVPQNAFFFTAIAWSRKTTLHRNRTPRQALSRSVQNAGVT